MPLIRVLERPETVVPKTTSDSALLEDKMSAQTAWKIVFKVTPSRFENETINFANVVEVEPWNLMMRLVVPGIG